MALRHFEAIDCKSDGGFCVASSTLTGNTWNGSLWYFNGWEHYERVPNVDMYAVTTADGISDIKWYNDNRVIVGQDSGVLEVWSIVAPGNDLEHVSVFESAHDEMVLCVGVTCDGGDQKSVFSGGGDGKIIVSEMENGKSLGTFKGHRGWATSLDPHPCQSNVFVSAGMDLSMKIWDLRNPSFVTDTISPSDPKLQGSFNSVSWSKLDGNLIATGSETGYVSVYDTRHLSQPLVSVHSHTRSIHRVLVSNDMLVSASDDCTVQVYSINQQKTTFNDNSHSDFVRGLAWQQDGYLVSCGWDGIINRHRYPDSSEPCSHGVKMEVNMVHNDEKENRRDWSVKAAQKMEISHEQLNGLSRSIASSEECQ